MMIFGPLLLSLAVFLNLIELSSQSERSPGDDHDSAGSPQHSESTARSRSRSPHLMRSFPGVLNFRLEDLALIRLRPHNCPNRTFEFRRYVFPPDKPIRLRKSDIGQSHMPKGEQIVLSTSSGDVCAILDKKTCNHTILRAICTLAPGRKNRAKINMNTGEVKAMTADEMAECPVSTREPVAKHYAVFRLNPPSSASSSSSSSASSSTLAESILHESYKSSALSETFSTLLGYEFDDLPFIRLRPHNNPKRVFKLRIYVFPPDKDIGLRTNNRILTPMPSGEQIVLSTSNGELCALLLKSPNRFTSLRPILTSNLGVVERVKIKMSSGAVEKMTEEEIAECPGTAGKAITQFYKVSRL